MPVADVVEPPSCGCKMELWLSLTGLIGVIVAIFGYHYSSGESDQLAPSVSATPAPLGRIKTEASTDEAM